MSANDPKNLIIPTGWIKAKTTLPTATPEKPASYDIDFGKFEKASAKIGGDLKESFSPLNGALGLDAMRRVKNKLTYEAELKYLDPASLERFMGSASGAAPRPGKVFDLWGWIGFSAEDEPIVAAGTGVTNEGAGILVHHSFKGAFTLDGDFTANGDDFVNLKLTINVYLGSFPGIWTAAARPVVATTS